MSIRDTRPLMERNYNNQELVSRKSVCPETVNLPLKSPQASGIHTNDETNNDFARLGAVADIKDELVWRPW